MNLPLPHTHTGLIGWLEETRVRLPLKGVEARFTCTGDVLEVTIDQIYHQNQTRPLDVTYSFPLPAGAAVHRCEMRVNDRTITAKVLPVGEARRLAAAKKADGHRTAVVESVRENLFELNLGNLAPGDTVVIRLGYVQSVDRDGSPGEASFRIPMTPGVRYIPGVPLLRRNSGGGTSDDTEQVPDASRISPPRIDSLHPDAAYLSLEGTVDPAGWDVDAMTSPSHPLLVRRDEHGCVRLSLVGSGDVPDRDIVVRMRSTAEGMEPYAWSCAQDGYQYGLIRLVASRVDRQGEESPRDFYFLVDRSGSMEGTKWRACAQALREFLGRMGTLDRACVTFFRNDFQDLAEKPLPVGAILAEPSVAGLEQMDVGGGTDLLPALKHVLEVMDRHRSPERETTLVIITDGQVGNEEEIRRLLALRQGQLRVYTFGIDHAVNDAFLRQLAEEHEGSSTLATPQDDIPGLVAGIAGRLGRAVWRKLRVESPWEGSGARIPSLWEGDAVTMAIRSVDGSRDVEVVGESALTGQEVRFRIPLQIALGEGPKRLWQRQRIASLDRMGSYNEAATLACEANLLSQLTAFVAWDEEERIALPGPSLEVYQPSLVLGVTGGFPRPLPKATVRLMPGYKLPLRAPTAVPAVAEAPVPFAAPPVPLRWQVQLPSLLNLDGPAAIRLADWLEQWLWAKHDQTIARQRMLLALIAELRPMATLEPRIARFLAWVAVSIEPPIRQSVERVLHEANPVA